MGVNFLLKQFWLSTNIRQYRYFCNYSFGKNLFSLVFAGIIGGVITLSGVYLLNNSQVENAPTIENYAQPVSNNLNVRAGSATAPFDFADAAEKQVVVVMTKKVLELLLISFLEILTKVVFEVELAQV